MDCKKEKMFKIYNFLHKNNEPLRHALGAIISIGRIRVFVSTLPMEKIVHMHCVNEKTSDRASQPASCLIAI